MHLLSPEYYLCAIHYHSVIHMRLSGDYLKGDSFLWGATNMPLTQSHAMLPEGDQNSGYVQSDHSTHEYTLR